MKPAQIERLKNQNLCDFKRPSTDYLFPETIFNEIHIQNHKESSLNNNQNQNHKNFLKDIQKASQEMFDFDSLLEKNRQFCCKCRRSLSLSKSIFIHHYRKFYCVVCFSQYMIYKTKQLSQYVQGDTWSHIKFRFQVMNCKNIHIKIDQWISQWSIAQDFALIKGLQKFGVTSFGDIQAYLTQVGIKKSKKQIQIQFEQLNTYLTQNLNERINDENQISTNLKRQQKRKQVDLNYKKWNKMSKTKKQMLKYLDFDQKRWEFQRNSGSTLDIYEIILSEIDDIKQQLDFQQDQFEEVKQYFLTQYITRQQTFQNACHFLLESDFLQGKYIMSKKIENQQTSNIQNTIEQELIKQIFSDQISFSIPYIENKNSKDQDLSQLQQSEEHFNPKSKSINMNQSQDIFRDQKLNNNQVMDLGWIATKKRKKQINHERGAML